MSDRRTGRSLGSQPVGYAPAHVVWHDLECGGYRADLGLWRELAQRSGGRVLDVGAGAGRVSLDLARAGLAVTALDFDATLLAALDERATGLEIETVCADARSFALERRDFGACLVPMQTIQLLGGTAGRVAFLRRAREHVRSGGVVACAILGALEPFDCSDGGAGPAAERVHVDGLLYLSRATRVSELAETVVIERERRVLDDRPGVAERVSRRRTAEAERAPLRDSIELDRVSARDLQREAREAGLRPLERLEVPATAEHVGSVVVVLGV
ncbi:MAG TPA: class I SAM-dependent methyltransferase [Solirubrobacteraceae bacterium]|nr:class I SAM-dependent methyltransferase [Solirubrobacteraceae bacterium]